MTWTSFCSIFLIKSSLQREIVTREEHVHRVSRTMHNIFDHIPDEIYNKSISLNINCDLAMCRKVSLYKVESLIHII
jgi:hypothetical protein